MTSQTDELKARFQTLAERESSKGAAERRRDYKGQRRKMTLRVGQDVMEKLALLRMAGNVESNEFCVAVLEAALDARLNDLQKTFDKTSWDVMVRCANAKAGKGS